MSVKVPLARSAVEQLRSAGTTAAVALLLAIYVVLSVGASLHKGLSYDEGEQLAIGYNIWTNGDFRMEGADGDLIKRWATLPYLISLPRPATQNNEFWQKGSAYIYGYEFFFYSGNPAGWLLLQGRLMAVLIGALTGFLVFICARELFGALGGVFALAIFVFSPNMLAFGAMVSTDMSVCLTLLGATWCVWRLLHRVTYWRLLLSLAFSSTLLLAKLSGLAIFPITFILILTKVFSGKPLEWRLGRPREITSPAAQSGVFAGLLILHVLCAWAVLWAHYDFRFYANPHPADKRLVFTHYVDSDPIDSRVAAIMDWTREVHLLPEGFLQGVHTLLTSNDSRESFVSGRWYVGGDRLFFLYALWDKTPPVLYCLLIIAIAGWWWKWRRSLHSEPEANGDAAGAIPQLYYAMPYIVLIAVFLFIAILQNVDIGHRHILPIYPPFYILVGGALALVWTQTRTWARLTLALLLAVLPLDAVLAYPNYLAYFSPLVGGTNQGYRRLVDSSLDWGMDLPALKQWLDVNNPDNKEPVFLAYFGTDSPEYYGIFVNRLPSTPDWRVKRAFPYSPGIYAISATLYESMDTYYFGSWTVDYEGFYQKYFSLIKQYELARRSAAQFKALMKQHPLSYWNFAYSELEKLRFNRLCAWLRVHRPVPDANLNGTILIWHLNQADVESAILGPAPEKGMPPMR